MISIRLKDKNWLQRFVKALLDGNPPRSGAFKKDGLPHDRVGLDAWIGAYLDAVGLRFGAPQT